jgi:hypothetical protein
MPRKVDIEMQDMASQLGVSLRDLMAGIMTGRFSEHVTEDDIVHGDKGDPLFFRLDQNRAFGICGSDLPEVEKDMSTVERMSQGGSVRNVQTDTAQDSGQVPAEKSGSQPAQKTGSPPAETGETSEAEEAGDGGGLAEFFGTVILGGVGVAVVASAFSQNEGLTQEEREKIFHQGVNARAEGRPGNPYSDRHPEAAEVYRRGWWDAHGLIEEKAATN